jgi:hypothetical protein
MLNGGGDVRAMLLPPRAMRGIGWTGLHTCSCASFSTHEAHIFDVHTYCHSCPAGIIVTGPASWMEVGGL